MKISFIIPTFNEEGNVAELYNQINSAVKDLDNYEFIYMFIENGSTDNTLKELIKISKNNQNVKIIKLSRNFKMDGAIAAGLNSFNEDAAIIMTANLQDDPTVIPEFIKNWELGYDQVYGVVKSRPGKSILRKLNSVLFYKIANKLTKNLIPKDVSDFRLVDKRVVDAVKEMGEVNRFYRGFFSWVGFKSKGIEFNRQERFSSSLLRPYLYWVLQLGVFLHLQLAIKNIYFINFINPVISLTVLFIKI